MKSAILISAVLALSACAGPQVTRVQTLSKTADAPYDNVLVVSLFESFEVRRNLETEIVKELRTRGVTAVPSTSMMNTKTPVTRETFRAMVDSLGSDAVLVTQMVNLETEAKLRDARPEATYNLRPTYYFNVWNVELAEYTKPQGLQTKHSLALATQLYSAAQKEPVWGIESKIKFSMNYDETRAPAVVTAEAKSIVSYLSRDGLLAR